jgi:hypothetical protein
MPYSAERASALIGKPRSEYECNHVVNEALNGDKSTGGRARDYLNYGKKVDLPEEGAIVVGTDGVHVGIFISEREFIHSSSSRAQVIRAPLSQLPHVFPNGYQIRN